MKTIIKLILGLSSLPAITGVDTIIQNATTRTNHTNDNVLINQDINTDIKNYNISTPLFLNSEVEIKNHVLKELFTLQIRTLQYKTVLYKKYGSKNKINIDLKNMKASVQAYNQFEHRYYDPNPEWCDPTYASRWEDRYRQIKPRTKNLVSNIKIAKKGFANEYSFGFNSKQNDWTGDKHTLAYPDHNYLIYRITYYNDAYFRELAINKQFKFYEVDSNKIISNFIEFKNIPRSNNGLIWNENTKKLINDRFTFNNNLVNLKTLSLASEIVQKINNNLQTYQYDNQFTKQLLQSYLNDLTNLKFTNYKMLKNLDNYISNPNENKVVTLYGNFSHNLESLNASLTNTGFFENKDQAINISNALSYYRMVISFLKHNDIEAEIIVNDSPLKIKIWQNNQFISILDQLKNYPNLNYLKVNFSSINNIFKGDLNNLGYFFSSSEITDTNILNNYNFDIFYRSDALNINNQINSVLSNDGLILNTNRYVSELVGTGKHIGNGIENNYINPDTKIKLIQLLADVIKIPTTHLNLYDIATNDLNLLRKEVDVVSLAKAMIKFNINPNDKVIFSPSNIDGKFYSIIKIKNWQFSDGTDGDFSNMFKNAFIGSINDRNLNIIELKPNTKTFNTNGYFLLKLKTNRVQFSISDNLYDVQINNSNQISEHATTTFKNTLYKKNNWILQKINKTDRLFLVTNEFTKNKVSFDATENNLKALLFKNNYLFDAKHFTFPKTGNDLQQVYKDILNNPIIKMKYVTDMLFKINDNKLQPTKLFNEIFEIKSNNNKYQLVSKNKSNLQMNLSIFDLHGNQIKSSIETTKNSVINKISSIKQEVSHFNNKQSFKKIASYSNYSDIIWFTITLALIVGLMAFVAVILTRKKLNKN